MFTESDKTKLVTLRTAVLQLYSKKLSELNDPKLTSLFFNHCVISGGAISAMYWGETPKDIDVYAKDNKDIKVISDFITDVSIYIKSAEAYDLNDALVPNKLCVTNNAITLKNDIQFITLTDIETARKQFDFVHCMPWIDIKTQKLHISEAQFESIKLRNIILNKKGEPPKEYRVQKYVSKGWNFNS
jgi:hypothetical protein